MALESRAALRHNPDMREVPAIGRDIALDAGARAVAPASAAAVLVVVPTLDEEAHIEACLRSILGDDPVMAGVDIVVADGGSRDRTVAIVEGLAALFPNIRVLANPERLQSAGINLAVARCARPRHRILVRCDAHATYPPGYVLAVARRLVDLGVASVVVPIDAHGSTAFGRAAAWIVDTPLGNGGAAHRGGTVSRAIDHGHHAGFDLDWFRRLGGYDPAFSHNEDAEYDLRLARAGGTAWLAADLRVAYTMRPTLAGLARQYTRYGRGRARTVLKHHLRPKPRQLAPVALVLALAAAVILSPVWPALLLVPLGYAAALLGVGLWTALSRRSLAGLWAGPALGAMHLAWGAGFLRQVAAAATARVRRTRRRARGGQGGLGA